jgi:hypothetical protein
MTPSSLWPCPQPKVLVVVNFIVIMVIQSGGGDGGDGVGGDDQRMVWMATLSRVMAWSAGCAPPGTHQEAATSNVSDQMTVIFCEKHKHVIFEVFCEFVVNTNM